MATISCENGIPLEDVEDYGILPSDIATGEYIFLDDCCNYGTEGSYVVLSLVSTISGMEPGESQDVVIADGCPPYKWDVPLPMSFTEYYTTTVSNTLFLAYGAEPQSLPTDIVITDVCYEQGSPVSEPVEVPTGLVTETATGDTWSIYFIANTPDCYVPGEQTEIELIVPYTITQVTCPNPGCIVTGLNPVLLTTPEGYDSTVSLSITMLAEGYEWANGDPVYGTTVMSVEVCVCEHLDNNITYTTQQMSVDEQQTLGVDEEWDDVCFSWEITEGLGSLGTPAGNGDVVYTAPSWNDEDCDNDPTITLFKEEVPIDTLKISINGWEDPDRAYYIVSFDRCVPNGSYNMFCYVFIDNYDCDGNFLSRQNPLHNWGTFPVPNPTCDDCMANPSPGGDPAYDDQIADSPHDTRNNMPGCCPEALL